MWLGEAEHLGGVRAARVLEASADHLTLERIALVAPALGAGEAFGRALAITHATGAPWFGAPPPGWSGMGSIGRAPLSFARRPEGRDSWGDFYARHRIAPYVRAALKTGALPSSSQALFTKLIERLEAGEYDTRQPALVDTVARIHGDLWAGNVLWTSVPWPDRSSEEGERWTGAVVVDPAAHGGHAETDLAMLALFGIPQLAEIIAGYESVSRLEPGWQDRVGLHQLHPLLVHAVLFGASYGQRAIERASESV
jgi:fructosamine-3-kinase